MLDSYEKQWYGSEAVRKLIDELSKKFAGEKFEENVVDVETLKAREKEYLGVDVRLQKSFPIVSKVKIDGMIETYNLFNHENFGSYTTNMASAQFGRPSANAALAYQPRMMQLGIKFTF